MAGEELSTILSSLIEPAFEKVTCSPSMLPSFLLPGYSVIAMALMEIDIIG